MMDTNLTWGLSMTAAALAIMSTAFVMEKEKIGWVIGIGSAILYIVYALLIGVHSFIYVQMATLLISVMAVLKWRNVKKHRHIRSRQLTQPRKRRKH